MLNYEEELKKFKPCLDVDEVEDAIYSRDLTDVQIFWISAKTASNCLRDWRSPKIQSFAKNG